MTKTTDIVSTTEFIELYKKYETILRNVLDLTPYDYEKMQSQQVSSRLQIIRLNRNYIQHETDPYFVKISQAQYNFLINIINDIKLKQGSAKDGMIPIRKYPHLYADMTVTEAIDVFAASKTDQIPVIKRETGVFLGMCSPMQLLKYINKTRGTTKLVPQRAVKEQLELSEAPTIEADAMLYDLKKEQLYIVTKNGKTIGVLQL